MEKDKKIIFVSLLLAFICVGLLGYIVYFRIYESKDENKIKNNDVNKDIVDVDSNNKGESEVIQEENNKLTEEEVKKLYAVISDYPEFRELNVNFYSLSEATKDKVVINYLNSNCIDSVSISKEEFLNTYKTLFNNEKTNEDGICSLEDENYQCEVVCEEEFVKLLNKYERFEVNEDMLVIYEKAVHLEHHDDGNIYLKETIDSNDNIKSYTSIDDIKLDEISSELPTYKHTFKLNNGFYYWLKSELVKQ